MSKKINAGFFKPERKDADHSITIQIIQIFNVNSLALKKNTRALLNIINFHKTNLHKEIRNLCSYLVDTSRTQIHTHHSQHVLQKHTTTPKKTTILKILFNYYGGEILTAIPFHVVKLVSR